MRLLAVLACVSSLPLTVPAQGNTPADSSAVYAAEFRQLAEQWKQAYNSKDAGNLAPLYAEDAQYISAHVDGCIADGRP
ncbi:MAG TPA: hypothetical protein VGA55_01740 [Bacteroidota bacterium]